MKITEINSTKEIYTEIAERCKQYRISSNLTQADLAKKAFVSIKTISRFENGEDISLAKFFSILKVLGLSQNIDFLVPDHTERPSYNIGNRQYRKRASKKKIMIKRIWKWGDEK